MFQGRNPSRAAPRDNRTEWKNDNEMRNVNGKESFAQTQRRNPESVEQKRNSKEQSNGYRCIGMFNKGQHCTNMVSGPSMVCRYVKHIVEEDSGFSKRDLAEATARSKMSSRPATSSSDAANQVLLDTVLQLQNQINELRNDVRGVHRDVRGVGCDVREGTKTMVNAVQASEAAIRDEIRRQIAVSDEDNVYGEHIELRVSADDDYAPTRSLDELDLSGRGPSSSSSSGVSTLARAATLSSSLGDGLVWADEMESSGPVSR